MGYNLAIGNGTLKRYDEDDESYFRIEVETVKHETAPAFGEPTDYTNKRWPSYTQWSCVMDFYGIDKTIFIQEHPGAVPLTRWHKDYINAKYEEYKKKYPDSVAEYPEQNEMGFFKTEGRECDINLCRLEWLKYWINWAVDNCENPTFYNS